MQCSWTYLGEKIIDFDDNGNLDEKRSLTMMTMKLLPDRATADGEIFGKLQERVKQRLQVLEYKIPNAKYKLQMDDTFDVL